MKNKIFTLGFIFILFIVVASGFANAGGHSPAPSTPAPPSGGGGSSSSSGGYNPPSFTKSTTILKSSDGSAIGRFEGKDFNSVMVYAERNGTIGNVSYDLSLEGELSAQPSDDCWLDINFTDSGSSGLPPGMENSIIFATVNVAKKPNDWGYKSGSPKYVLTISRYNGSMSSGSDYFLVRSDGSGYQIQKVSAEVSGDQLTVTFSPPGDTGVFTLLKAVTITPTPTPTPTPVATPTPTPSPMPDNNMWSFPIFIAMFVVGAIAGAFVIFLFMRNK